MNTGSQGAGLDSTPLLSFLTPEQVSKHPRISSVMGARERRQEHDYCSITAEYAAP